jgi:hypothetical protein
MMPKFGYSFDRDTFHGQFDTRQAALAEAMKALKNRSDVPEGIFVGQWIEPDPRTTDHAERIIDAMRDRWDSSPESGEYLPAVSDQEMADLDAELDRAIRGWLTKHNLLPAPVKVRGVSEHPVPNVHHVAVPAHERETSMMGEA